MRRSSFSRGGFARALNLALVALLLLLAAGGAVVLYRLLRPDRFTATALFNVDSDEPNFAGEPIPFDARQNEIFRKTQLAYFKSYFVIQTALRTPGVEALSILAPHADKVKWVQENLDVGYEGEHSDILRVRLQSTEEQSEDIRKIVDAVCEAYLKEAVFENEQRQLVIRDAKERASAELRKKIERLIESRNESTDRSAEAIAEGELMRAEVEGLMTVYRNLVSSLEIDKLNRLAPNRIRQIQNATVASDAHPLPGLISE